MDPTGAVSAQVSRARSLVSTYGEARSLANHAGTSRVSIGFADFLVVESGVALGLSPTGIVSFVGTGPSEARGAGLGRKSRVGVSSEGAGPHAAKPVRSTSGSRNRRAGRMPSGLSGDVVQNNVGQET